MATAVAAAVLAPMVGSAQELEVSANAGWVSEYYYRGIFQNTSSASGGFDLALGGLYAGTWAADVGDGNEVDLYAGYELAVGEGYLGIGGTGYFYTGDFDDTYLEANLTAGFGPLGVEFSIGTYETEPESADYWFLGVTAEQEGLFVTVGTFGADFEGMYAEAGYGFTVADLDASVSWIYSDEDLAGLEGGDHTLVFGVSKTFAIR
ncbi:MAG: TorF family putative porin [Gemmatimonadota bacterium]